MPFLPLAQLHTPFPPLPDTDKHQLFHCQRPPRYELADLKNKPHLMIHPKYSFFVELVEEWNNNISRPRMTASPLEHEKIKFIHSSLRSMTLQSQTTMQESLQKMYQWYQGLAVKSTPVSLSKKSRQKIDDEQWEIRHTYKSNLPLELDNYNRRICFEDRIVTNSNAVQPLVEEKRGFWDERIKQKHCAVRESKQNREMVAFGRMMRRNKARFDHLPSRNFYKQEFHHDKVYKKRIASKMERDSQESEVEEEKKDMRAQTMANWSSKSQVGLVKGGYSTASSNFYPHKPNEHTLTQQLPLNLSSSVEEMPTVDGTGLLINPFQPKTKPRRR